MASWNLERAPEIIPVAVTPEQYSQLIDEMSEVLVDCYCQFIRDQNRKLCPLEAEALSILQNTASNERSGPRGNQ